MASIRYLATGESIDAPVPTTPLGYLNGDLLLAFVYLMQPLAAGSDVIETPVGWTLVAQDSQAFSDGSIDRFAVFRRTSTGVEPPSYTFAWTGSGVACVRMVSFRGAAVANPITTPGIVKNVSASPISIDLPIVTTSPGQRVLAAWAARTADYQWTIDAFANEERLHTVSRDTDDDPFGTFPDAPSNVNVGYDGKLDVAEYLQAAAGLTTKNGECNAQMGPDDQIGFGLILMINPA